MTDELDRLEREVEAAMKSLPVDFSVDVAATLVTSVKAVVRHEINEEWLISQPAPLPSADALRRVHDAVRGELARSRAAVRRPAWARMASALAAAAMIAISIGVIRVAGMHKRGTAATSPEIVAAENHLQKFIAAAENVFSSESLTQSIHDDLSTIEEDIDGWRTAGDETGGLGDVVREIDSSMAEPAGGKGVSQVSSVPKARLG
jgi:hypothetical protein